MEQNQICSERFKIEKVLRNPAILKSLLASSSTLAFSLTSEINTSHCSKLKHTVQSGIQQSQTYSDALVAKGEPQAEKIISKIRTKHDDLVQSNDRNQKSVASKLDQHQARSINEHRA